MQPPRGAVSGYDIRAAFFFPHATLHLQQEINDDGRRDLALVIDGKLAVYLQPGAGDWGVPTYYALGVASASLAAADFNGDKKLDLAAINNGNNSVAILLDNGAGAFSAPANYPVGHWLIQILPGDFTGDTEREPSAAVPITNGAFVPAELVTINSTAPGLFTVAVNGRGLAAAQVLRIGADNALCYEPSARLNASNQWEAIPIELSNANEQVFLVAYGTDMRGRALSSPATATIGGANVEVLFAGMQGGLVGLDQVNIRLLRTLSGRGNVDVVLIVDGKAVNPVSINVK